MIPLSTITRGVTARPWRRNGRDAVDANGDLLFTDEVMNSDTDDSPLDYALRAANSFEALCEVVASAPKRESYSHDKYFWHDYNAWSSRARAALEAALARRW